MGKIPSKPMFVRARGGRMTKIAGRTASFAPVLSHVLGGVSAIALGAALSFPGGSAQAGECTGAGGVFTCSGDATVGGGVGVDLSASGSLTVTTAPGFAMDVNAAVDDAIYLDAGSITFTDNNASTISASGGTTRRGIDAQADSGSISLTTSGDVTGRVGGIRAETYRSNGQITITATNATAAGASFGTGIEAYAYYGTVDISVTATGTVSGTSRGVVAESSYSNGSITVDVNNVTGTNDSAVIVNNTGGTFVSITTKGTVSGGLSGISTSNDGSYLKIETAGATGGDNGIFANNDGSGDLSITASGDVTGTSRTGIDANSDGTNLTIDVTNVTGGETGIDANNNGSGNLSVTSTGLVQGGSEYGIYAFSADYSGDLTIDARDVTGGTHGIYALNDGTGNVSIKASGQVTGSANHAILASGYGDVVSVEAANATGNLTGIYARQNGSGDLMVSSSGTVMGTTSYGIDARITGSGGELTIDVVDVTGASSGIEASVDGEGSISITSTGAVVGTNNNGVYATLSDNNAGSLKVDVNDVYGGYIGVLATSFGNGAISVTSSGDVMGVNAGIAVMHYGSGAILITTNGAVSGGRYSGIYADRYDTGEIQINVHSEVTGGPNPGIGAIPPGAITTNTLAGGMSLITLHDGADVSSGTGIAITNNEGDSRVVLQSGSKVTGEILLNDGSDEVELAGGDISAATMIDGGDDNSAADGFIDVVRVTGTDIALGQTQFTNFEQFIIDGGSASFNGGTLTGGDGGTDTGLFLTNSGVLQAGAAFTLEGNLFTSSSGTFKGMGNGAGVFRVNGDVENGGVISLQDGAAGDVLTVNGDFTGDGGQLALDTVLGDDGSDTDMLVITGDTAGSTSVVVTNAGGGGDVTATGIELISVGGNSDGSFTLVGDFETDSGEKAVVAGAFAYTLGQDGNGDWRLTSEMISDGPTTPRFQPGAPVYEALPDTLHQLQDLPTFGTRMADRRTSSGSGGGVFSFAEVLTPGASPFWINLDVTHWDYDPQFSTTGSQFETRLYAISGGADFVLSESASGDVIGGISLHYGHADGDVTSNFGIGSVDSDAYGIGLSMTWLGHNGFYADGQFRYSVFESDLTSNTLGPLVGGNDGDGYAVSVEIGQSFAMANDLTLTPQAQLTYAEVDFDTFLGPAGERVSLDNADSLELRMGLAAEKSYQLATGGSQTVYGSFDLIHEFEPDSQVDVSGVKLVNRRDDWTARFGMGLRHSWNGRSSVFGELAYTTGAEDFGDSRMIQATAGVRFSF